jgi:hypothetical protein
MKRACMALADRTCFFQVRAQQRTVSITGSDGIVEHTAQQPLSLHTYRSWTVITVNVMN